MTDREQSDPLARTPNRSGYRCRAHHDQRVTWRGTGCTKCPPPGIRKPKQRKRTKPTTSEGATQ